MYLTVLAIFLLVESQLSPASQPAAPADVAGFFDDLRAAIRSKEFDSKHFVDARRLVGKAFAEQPAELINGLHEQLTLRQKTGPIFFDWESLRFGQIKAEPDGYTVTTRMLSDGEVLRQRWFLVRGEDGRLRMSDLEDLSVGMRISAAIDDGFRRAMRNPAAMRVLLEFESARQEIMNGDPERARQLMEGLDPSLLPPAFQRVRLVLLAQWKLHDGDYADVLKLVETINADGEMPAAVIFKAGALLELEDYHGAIAAARRHEELIGINEDSSIVLTAALRELKDTAGALAACEQGLSDAPASADLLGVLGQLVPARQQPQVGERLRSALAAGEPFSHDAFQALALELESEETAEALAAVTEAYAAAGKKEARSGIAIEYFRASSAKQRRQHSAAADAFIKIAKCDDEEYADWAVDDYIVSIAFCRKGSGSDQRFARCIESTGSISVHFRFRRTRQGENRCGRADRCVSEAAPG